MKKFILEKSAKVLLALTFFITGDAIASHYGDDDFYRETTYQLPSKEVCDQCIEKTFGKHFLKKTSLSDDLADQEKYKSGIHNAIILSISDYIRATGMQDVKVELNILRPDLYKCLFDNSKVLDLDKR